MAEEFEKEPVPHFLFSYQKLHSYALQQLPKFHLMRVQDAGVSLA